MQKNQIPVGKHLLFIALFGCVFSYGQHRYVPDYRKSSEIKLIRFGQQGVKGFGKVKTKQGAEKRAAFRARHAKNIAKGKMSGAYWSNRVKW